MQRQKKFFLVIAAVFFLLLFYVSYDIGTRTTFPGSKGQLKERIKDRFGDKIPENSPSTDSLFYDSASRTDR